MGDEKDSRRSAYERPEILFSSLQNSTNWWNKTEAALREKARNEIFEQRKESVAFVCKIWYFEKVGISQHLLVVGQGATASRINVYIVDMETWEIVLNTPLNRLCLVDGLPQTEILSSEGFDHLINLVFDERGIASIDILIALVSYSEKSLLAYNLLEICEKMLDVHPVASNISQVELRLLGNNPLYVGRCTLTGPKAAPKRNESDSDDDESYDEDEISRKRPFSAKIFSGGFGPKEIGVSSQANQEAFAEIVLPDDVIELLQEKDLRHLSCEDLLTTLNERVSKLEGETSKTMLEWEQVRETSGDSEGNVDPVSIVLNRLEAFGKELDELDDFLAQDYLHIEAMQKDVAKVEDVNGVLRCEAENRSLLYRHLTKVLAQYTIPSGIVNTVNNIDCFLNEQLKVVVENAPQEEANALSYVSKKACNCALKLADALRLGQNKKNGMDLFPESEYLVSTQERKAKVLELVSTYCFQVEIFMSYRVNTHFQQCVDMFRAQIVDVVDDDAFPQLMRFSEKQHMLSSYGQMVETLLLRNEGFLKVQDDYNRASERAYSEILAQFVPVIVAKQFGGSNDASYFLGSPIDTIEEALNHDENSVSQFANDIFSGLKSSCAMALNHCLESISNMVKDETNCRNKLFLQNSKDAGRVYIVHNADANSMNEKGTGCPEINMNYFLSLAPDFMDDLLPSRGFGSAILCSVVAEHWSCIAATRDEFLMPNMMKYMSQLEPYFKRQIDSYLDDHEDDLRSCFHCLPSFVDRVVALWNHAAKAISEYDDEFGNSIFYADFKDFAECPVGRMLRYFVDQLVARLRTSATLKLDCLHYYVAVMQNKGGTALMGEKLQSIETMHDRLLSDFVAVLLYREFSGVIEFLLKVEELLERIKPHEVPFHIPRMSVVNLVKTVSASFIKKLIPDESCAKKRFKFQEKTLVAKVRELYTKELVEKYTRFSETLELCYGEGIPDEVTNVKLYLQKISSQSS